ncbi:MAG: hypothetical protein ACLQDY_28710 [Streptosporangiaceae bacterium]
MVSARSWVGETGFGGGDALAGGGAGGVDLGLGGFGVGGGAQLGDGAGEDAGMLGGELFQLADEFGGAGQSDGDGLAAGFLGPLAGGVGFRLRRSRWALSGLWLASSQYFGFAPRPLVSARGDGLLASGVRVSVLFGSSRHRSAEHIAAEVQAGTGCQHQHH